MATSPEFRLIGEYKSGDIGRAYEAGKVTGISVSKDLASEDHAEKFITKIDVVPVDKRK